MGRKTARLRSCICGALLMAAVLLLGIHTDADEPLGTDFAVAASSLLADRDTISYTAILPELPASDDGMLYLYELQPSQYEVEYGSAPIASAQAALAVEFTVPYTESRLYTKLGLAVHLGDMVVLIANPQYIANPELLAQYTKPRQERGLKSEQGEDFCNLYLSGNINGVLAGSYTTAQVMNDGSNQTITNPYARAEMLSSDTHPKTPRYYMLNARETQGIQAIADELKLCAAYSTVENFIIGNEVNTRVWNYMVWTDWETYIREYAQAFRVAYNAIKSQNANARVFVCIDQNWDRNRSTGNSEYYEYIDAKDFLAYFNELISSEGNIDWGVAQHPYPVPLTYAKFWDMSGCANGAYMAAQVSSGKMLSFQNLSVLTDYLQSPEMLSPEGTVRHVILSEIGITNTQGTDVQAAAIYASYMAAKRNPYIEEIIYLLAYSEPGIDTRLGGMATAVYNSLGTVSEGLYDTWVKAVIGISDWSEVLW